MKPLQIVERVIFNLNSSFIAILHNTAFRAKAGNKILCQCSAIRGRNGGSDWRCPARGIFLFFLAIIGSLLDERLKLKKHPHKQKLIDIVTLCFSFVNNEWSVD